MDHRLFAILAVVCFALGGAGCASESDLANREEILMPRQTGSTLNRRVMVETSRPTKKSKKKDSKKDKKESKKESKPATAKTTPTPAPETPEATPEETPAAPPDRFR